MAVDLSQLGGLLKRVYTGPLNKAIGERVLLWNDLSTLGMKRTKVVGETMYWAVLLRGAKGVGFRGANEFLPVGDASTTQQANTGLSRFYATVDVDKMTTEIAGPTSSSFADYLTLQMKLIEDEAAFHLNRSLHGDGTGALATITTTDTYATGAPIDLTHVNGYSFGSTQFIEDLDTRVVIIHPTTYAVKGTGKVSDIDWDNGRIQLDSDVTVAANDLVVLGDSFGHSGGNKEAKGLRYMISDGTTDGTTVDTDLYGADGTIFGIAPATYRRWKSRILNRSTSEVPYNWDQAYRLVKTCMARGGKNAILLMHPAIAREHRRLYENDVRYAPTNIDFEKGQKTPAINVDGKMIRIVEDPYLGFQEMIAVEPGDLFKNVIRELSPDTDGGGKLKQSHGKDAYWAYWRMYYGLGATNLNRLGRFDGVKVSTDFVADLHKDI